MRCSRRTRRRPPGLSGCPYDLKKLQRWFGRLAQEGAELRACYEASGAGYVLQRAVTGWGYSCEIVASALIPTKAGDRRKHDKKDAANLARLYRAGELTPIRIPTEAEERVREIVRCRETLGGRRPSCTCFSRHGSSGPTPR